MSAAVRRLQDAQGAENVAQAKLTDLQNKGNASASQLAAAEERLQKAHRAVASATIGLANAHDRNDQAMRKSEADTRRLAASADQAKAPVVNLWAALGTIAPAVVPIAGVATGALLGLGAAGVVAILGVKGISDEFKSGALRGTQYQADIQSLVNQFSNLKQTAANGLLGGVDQAIQSSGPLFAALNQDVGVLSSQLGTIVAGAAPALLAILNALNPLFVTFGNLLASGATKLEHWATSSDGITKFVAYVQQELPIVMDTLAKLVVLFGHIVQAAAPIGDTVLRVLDGLATALNAIPVSALTGLGYAFVLLYPAVKIAGLVSAAVKAMGLEFPTAAAKAEAAAAVQEAAALQVQAAKADEALAVARANASEAESTAATSEAIAAATAGTSSVLAEGAVAAAAAAREFAVAMREEAVAAEQTAGVIAASSAEATASAGAMSAAVTGQAAVARSSAGAMMSVVGVAAAAYIGGRAISNMTEKNNAFAHAMDNSGAAADSFNQALLKTKGVVDANVRSTVQAQLQQDGLAAKAARSGISVDQLTTAVTGGDAAMAGLIKQWKASGKPSGDTLVALGLLAKQFDASSAAQKKFAASTSAATTARQSQQVAIAAQNAAAAKLYGLTGSTGVTAYLAATQAALQSTQQAQAQTLQWQMENDAGSLLAQTLDKLAGNNLSYAQAQNSFDSALSNMGDHISSTGKKITFTTTSINNMSSASVQLRGQLLGQVTSAEQTAEAYGKMKGSSEAGRQELIKLRTQIINNAVAHGVDRQAVTNYIDTVLKIPKSVRPTTVQIDKAQAVRDLATLKAQLDAVTQQQYTINVSTTISGPGSYGYVNVSSRNTNGTTTRVRANAAGGTIGDGPSGTVPGSGSGARDTHLVALADGEEVIRTSQARKHRGLLKAINAGMYSPALLMRELGVFTGQRFASQPLQLPSAVVPPITGPAAPGGGSGGLQLVQHIYPQPGQSEMAIAKAAASEQVWALRR